MGKYNNEAKDLVKKAQAGDLEAFEKLVITHQDKVFSHCYRLTGNYDDAQDLAQEVFVRAYKAIGSFRSDADLGTWLYRIAVNQYLNWRRQEKDNVISLDEPVEMTDGEVTRQVAAAAEDPLEEVERGELRELVLAGLARLPAEFRAALTLREFEGLSYEEIAEVMNCSVGTVRSRLNRARKALREFLKLQDGH
ncbi:MAG TPA: sigma-70 family RNA polymerase sigma factor [Syntrophothermus lipocalidus]|nr:sigma-70 family RNA polymerase sigma factor [Syntrophothermus lipocalidus]